MKAGSGPPFSFDPPIRLHIGYSSGKSPRSDLNGDEGHYARRTSMSRCSQKCPQSTPVPSHPHGFAVKLRADSRLKHSQAVCLQRFDTHFRCWRIRMPCLPLGGCEPAVRCCRVSSRLHAVSARPPNAIYPCFLQSWHPACTRQGAQITLAPCLWASIFNCWTF